MENEKTVMLREIALQSQFMSAGIDDTLTRIREVLAKRAHGALENCFMIGCGDSYCAALAARQFMMKTTGLFAEAVQALEFSHYLVDDLPKNSVVFGVSNSGTVSRTIEGVRLAREKGAWTFAVTVAADNKLAQTAETLIRVDATPNIKELPDGSRVVTPGSVTYTASMLGLFVSAIGIGEWLGSINATKSKQLVADLHTTAAAMAAADRPVYALAQEVAGSFTADRRTVILGGGPNYATGYFGMAKWFEALTRPVHFSELEEWAHEHYFMTDEKTDTFLILPPGAGRERGLEQARAAREMGSRIIIIGAAGDSAAKAASDIYFAMPAGLPEMLTPFVYKLPFEYLSCEISRKQNIAFLGFDNKRRQEVNFRQIFNSAESKTFKKQSA